MLTAFAAKLEEYLKTFSLQLQLQHPCKRTLLPLSSISDQRNNAQDAGAASFSHDEVPQEREQELRSSLARRMVADHKTGIKPPVDTPLNTVGHS
jgi:hypothetical protein